MVRFSNFLRLDPSVRDTALHLLGNAACQQSFMSFIYRWMAFNGWMSAITLEDTDAAMINALVAAPRLVGAYQQLRANDAEFRQVVDEFTALWPVLNVRSARDKLGYGTFWENDRATLLQLCAAAKVRQQPTQWVPDNEPTWEQLLRTIYQVRCNLFHGEKSPQAIRDRDLVAASDRTLAKFIDASGCFDWTDT